MLKVVKSPITLLPLSWKSSCRFDTILVSRQTLCQKISPALFGHHLKYGVLTYR